MRRLFLNIDIMEDFIISLAGKHHDYDCKISHDGKCIRLVIENPYKKENIIIEYSDSEFIFMFDFYHAHFYDSDTLAEYLNDALSDRRCFIRFFDNDRFVLASDMCPEFEDIYNASAMAKSFFHVDKYTTDVSFLENRIFQIRSWSGKLDNDCRFIIKDNKLCGIKKLGDE